MHRLRDRRPSTFFRGTELARLLTMIVMLGVLVMLIDLAGESRTWRWLAPETDEEAEQVAAAAPAVKSVATASEPIASGPTDVDAAEQDAAREEYQAVMDKAPLSAEEMPAYWRLMGWTERQSTDAMLERAHQDFTYNDLWHRPDKWRGQLLRMRVHLNQVIKNADLANNPLGMESNYEVYGWNADSNPNWYLLVVPRLPAGMPASRSIAEEGTFVGYFLKLQPYEDRQGKTRAMPLLIGQLVWHPGAGAPPAGGGESTWPWYVAGGLAVLLIARWAAALAWGPRVTRRTSGLPTRRDTHDVEAWLDEAESREVHAERNGFGGGSHGDGSPPSEMTGPAHIDE